MISLVYTTATKRIIKQIKKDSEIVEMSDIVSKAEWHFFPSEVTGKMGASEPLEELLKNTI